MARKLLSLNQGLPLLSGGLLGAAQEEVVVLGPVIGRVKGQSLRVLFPDPLQKLFFQDA